MRTSLFQIYLKSFLTFSLTIGALLMCIQLQSQPSASHLFDDYIYQGSSWSALNSKSESKSRWKTGLWIGLGAGIAGASIYGYSGGSTSLCNASKNQDAVSTIGCLGIIGGSGLVFGGLGAIIGSFVKKKKIKDKLGNQVSVEIREHAVLGHAVVFKWSF